MGALTKEEAAKRIGISVRSLERKMQQREIGYYRITNRPTFGEHHIEHFLRSKEVRPKGQGRGER
jgi:hypothetical protein